MCLIKIPCNCTLYLKSAKLEQQILCLMHFVWKCSAEVQLKIYWSIFDCAKVELLQVNLQYISLLKTNIIQRSYNPY